MSATTIKTSPAPWEAVTEGDVLFVRAADGFTVCTVVSYTDAIDEGSETDEDEGNARLLAASPDLAEIAAKTAKMRACQRAFFRTREGETLRAARALEIEVDALLAAWMLRASGAPVQGTLGVQP